MTDFNIGAFEELITSHYMTHIRSNLGEKGINILEELFQSIRKVYDNLDPEQITGSLVIFKTIDEQLMPISNKKSITLLNLSGIHQGNLDSIAIQVLNNGQFILWRSLQLDLKDLSEEAIVYEYHDRTERLFSNKEIMYLPKLINERASMFSTPTFSDLRNALDEYGVKMVRYSSCQIFNDVWYEKNRIFLKNHPEFIFRNSLVQFLKSRLRDRVEVRPEQIMDESHPVDIKISWMTTNRLAIIEIKWLGKSKKDDGTLATQYTESRAKEGAIQLSEYLEMNKVQAPEHLTRGFLVVIDVRRRTPKEDIVEIKQQEGLYYQNKEIEFEPKYHEIRSDFDNPKRMFVEPVCNAS